MVVFEGETTVVGSLHCWAVHISSIFHQPQAVSRMPIYSDTSQKLPEIPADSRNDQSMFVALPLYIATISDLSNQNDRMIDWDP
jgi:hypothetical protein